jgi:cytochrome bd ubiquinol oxidase subunit I
MFDYVLLSRLQFAATALFHILWPVLTIGLSIFLVAMEALWLKTRDADYYRHARFWSKLFLLNFGVGVVTGLPMEFQFGMNWATFSTTGGDFFGSILGYEGAMAFMLEAGFLGLMVFGWKRVAPGIHLFATTMVALGASFSAFWIMVANSWMQTPAGGHFENGRFVIHSFAQAIVNPDMPFAVSHMWLAALETSLFVIGGISAWYLLRRRHSAFFLKSLKIALLAAVVVTPLQIYIGDGNGRNVAQYQPSKNGAIEGHWKTNPPGEGAPWHLVAWPNQAEQKNDWAVSVPSLLSILETHSLTGKVTGLRDIPRADQPPLVPLLFYAFRIMVAIGFYFFLVMLWTGWVWARGRLSEEGIAKHRWLLRAWVLAVPMGYAAVWCGWTVREVGRQPWVIYGVLRTHEGASLLPSPTVAASLIGYLVLYGILLTAFLVYAGRILSRGPDLSMPAPELKPAVLVDTRPELSPEERGARGT